MRTRLLLFSFYWAAIGATALVGSGCDGREAGSQEGRAHTGEDSQGYVMAKWVEEIPESDPSDCPAGLNKVEADVYPEEWAVFMAERQRIREAGGYLRWDTEILPPDACQDPLAQPDPGYLTIEGSGAVAGLDLDGIDSSAGRPDPGTCSHEDFAGLDGEAGIDNQFWRLMGCARGYRPNDLMERLHEANVHIKEAGYAVLMEIHGMDDPHNDDDVQVQILSAGEPVALNSVGGITQHASLDAHPSSRFHNAFAQGRIEDGILTTEPVDLRLKVKQQTSDNESWMRDARIRAEVLADGRIKGVVGGYWDVENLWSILNDQNIGDRPQGRNAAQSRGFMCSGLYHAMPRVADGHPDPETGACTSISSAIVFEAVPAFVIRPQVAMID